MNNETYGISLEVAIADAFDVEVTSKYRKRADETLVENIMPIVQDFFEYEGLPYPVAHVAEGQNPVDFFLEDGSTLSVKSNKNKLGKLAPQVVAQCTDWTWYEMFGDYIPDQDDYDNYYNMSYEERREVFKKTVLAEGNIANLMREYFEHMFGCDYIICGWNLYDDYGSNTELLYRTQYGVPAWEDEDFTFSCDWDIEKWNDSTTLYYCGTTIGEFQAHIGRAGFKFRFQMDKLLDLLDNGYIPFY